MPCVGKLCVAVVLLGWLIIGAILFAVYVLPLIVGRGAWWDEQTSSTTTSMSPTSTPHQCGIAPAAPNSSIRRMDTWIVNGNPTSGIERWPWVVYFYARPNDFVRLPCTGTLIAPRWVLTAAHCTKYSVDEEKARNASYQGRTTTGLVTVNVGEWGERTATMKKVWRIHRHPDYQLIDLGKDIGAVSIHDLALLELKLPIAYSTKVQPICLPRCYEDRPDEEAWIAGWGQTVHGNDYSRPRELYEGRMRIRNFSDGCEMSTDSVNFTSRYFICQRVGPSSTGVGDSGGPLMLPLGAVSEEGMQRWYEVGVKTWRKAGDDPPSYAERVSAYCGWIADVTDGEAQCVD